MRERPIGISILAVLHVIGGILLFALQVPLFFKLDELKDPLRLIGIPPLVLFAGMLFLAGLSTAAGIGLWLGQKWGWWLGAFYYVYAIARNASALLLVSTLAEELGETTRGPGYYYAKHAGRIIVHFLILLYFFKRNVLAYFGIESLSKWKAVSALIGICLGITVASSLPSFFAPSGHLDDIDVLRRSNPKGAIAQLEKALASNPRDDMAWTLLGHTHSDLNDNDQAETAYKKALEINPRRFQALTGMGILCRKKGQYDQALAYYEKALAIDPEYAQAFSSMTVIALKQGKDKKALEYAKRGYALDKTDPVIVANLAVAYHYNGMLEMRDKATEEAKGLGYHKIDTLQAIFSGEMTLRE